MFENTKPGRPAERGAAGGGTAGHGVGPRRLGGAARRSPGSGTTSGPSHDTSPGLSDGTPSGLSDGTTSGQSDGAPSDSPHGASSNPSHGVPSGPTDSARSGLSRGATLLAVAVVQFLVSLDLSVVNVGLPRIAAALDFTPVGLTWVIHAYALTFGGLLLLGGKAADRYGHKRVLLIGLVTFGAASLLGGFAEEPGHLIAARAAQGIGAAALAPAALALLTATFPTGRERVRAFGVWSAMNAAGGAFGVVAGGVLTEYAGWQWVMWVNVPMVAITLLLANRIAPGPSPSRSTRPDVVGAVLATAGMTLLVYGIVRTEHNGWTSASTLVPLTVAVVLLLAFLQVERTTERDPLVRLGLLTNRSVAGANLFNLLLGAAMASAFYFISLYLQRVLHHGPARTGLEVLPFALGVIVGSVVAIKLGYRFAPRLLLIGGGVVTASGFGWFGLVDADGTFLADVLGPSVVTSIGFGICLAPLVSTATAGVAAHESGTASGLLNSSRQLGAALGLAALGTTAHHFSDAPTPAGLSGGYALGLALCAALLLVAVLIAGIVLPRTTNTSAPSAQHERNT